MVSNKTLFIAIGSFLSLAACGGAAASAPDAPADAPAATEAESSPEVSPPPPPPATRGSDAGTDAKPITPSIARQCSGSVVDPIVCTENVQGRAGEIVDVELHLLGSTTCNEAFEAGGRMVFDTARFQLMNEVEQIDCRTRRLTAGATPGTSEIMWNAFGANVIAGCPNNLPLGKADVVKLRILPGTPPGDYVIGWSNSGFIGTTAECQKLAPGKTGIVRVLP